MNVVYCLSRCRLGSARKRLAVGPPEKAPPQSEKGEKEKMSASLFATTMAEMCASFGGASVSNFLRLTSRTSRDTSLESRSAARTTRSTPSKPLRKPQHNRTFAAKSFRIRSYEKSVCKSFRIRSYKNIGLKMPCFHTLTKNIGGWGPGRGSGLQMPGQREVPGGKMRVLSSALLLQLFSQAPILITRHP
jgi:hypothetical protein